MSKITCDIWEKSFLLIEIVAWDVLMILNTFFLKTFHFGIVFFHNFTPFFPSHSFLFWRIMWWKVLFSQKQPLIRHCYHPKLTYLYKTKVFKNRIFCPKVIILLLMYHYIFVENHRISLESDYLYFINSITWLT